MKMKEFLENVPPYQETEIEDINIETISHIECNKPEIVIFCEKCGGERFFKASPTNNPCGNSGLLIYKYNCKNCNNSEKIYAVIHYPFEGSHTKGKSVKIGEFPVFGTPTPSKLISLIGPDKDNFLKGRRCEIQGLGIGSYAYYRRVIEMQKNRIIDQIIKICEQYEQYDKNSELIKQLELAKNETRFSEAVDMIKQNLPSSLFINGHNPLKLLHKALSKGIHELDDVECLSRANNIRIVLTELCHRMSELLKDDKDLKNAINSLLKPEQEPPHA